MTERRKEDISTDDFMPIRELNLHLTGIHEKLDTIAEQTSKTNGRVTSLEAWRSRIIGALVVITPIVAYILKSHLLD